MTYMLGINDKKVCTDAAGSQPASAAVGASSTDSDLRSAILRLVQGFSIELTPAAAKRIPRLAGLLPLGTHVYLTSLPGDDVQETIALAARLRREGFEPVPHLAARNITTRDALEDLLARLVGEAGMTKALVVAGSAGNASGAFSDSLELLATGLLERHGIVSVGVAGHPEPSPVIPSPVHWHALAAKRKRAEQSGIDIGVVTQFCFDPAAILAYARRLSLEQRGLPLRVGVAGVASLQTLIRYAISCGVGGSIEFLKRQSLNAARLLLPRDPGSLLLEVARAQFTGPRLPISGLHFFPFGGMTKTATWAGAIAAGHFEIAERENVVTVSPR